MKMISLRLEMDQYKRLRLLSFVNNKPMSEVIRDALDEYMKEHQVPKPGQEWFWTESWQAAEREVEKELDEGKYDTYDTMEEFLKDLK
jgi:hypothetical protein